MRPLRQVVPSDRAEEDRVGGVSHSQRFREAGGHAGHRRRPDQGLLKLKLQFELLSRLFQDANRGRHKFGCRAVSRQDRDFKAWGIGGVC